MNKTIVIIDLIGCLFVISGIFSVFLSVEDEFESYHVVWLLMIISSGLVWSLSIHSSYPKHATMFSTTPLLVKVTQFIIISFTVLAIFGTMLHIEFKIFEVYSIVSAMTGATRLLIGLVRTRYVPFKFEDN